MSAPMIQPHRYRQLFLDDAAIESRTGLTRRLHQPDKRGPVIRPDATRGQTCLASRSIPQWNPEKQAWEWWFWCHYTVAPYGPYQGTSRALVHYAASDDGVAWQSPALGLFEWRGSKANNIASDPDLGPHDLYHILRDEDDPDPARRYKALFGLHDDRLLKVSADGFTWTPVDAPPIRSNDESHFTRDSATGQFIATLKWGTQWGRSVWLSLSRDFRSFTEPVLIFHSDELDRLNRRQRIRAVVENPAYLPPPIVDDGDYMGEIYQMAIMPYEGLYIGLPVLFNPAGAIPPPQMNHTGINQTELAVSRDLLHWERVADRAVFLGIEPWGGVFYETAQVLPCGQPILRGDEIWVYYNAHRFRGHRELYPNIADRYFEDTGALSLAKLRRDGFVSLDAGSDEGCLVTQPFEPRGALHVNVAAAGGGWLRAELLDADSGRTLNGYSAADCRPLEGDLLDGRIRWSSHADLPRSPARVRARFLLRNAALFSFWLSEKG